MVVKMSSYKVLPPYGDLGADYYSPLLMEPDVIYSASTDDFGQVSRFLLMIVLSCGGPERPNHK